MKPLTNALIGLVILMCSLPVFAELATFEISATVTRIDDINNRLGGAVTIGQQISGTYTFEVNVPDGDSSSDYAYYDQTFTGASGFDLLSGNLSFKSDPTQQGYMNRMDIINSYSDNYHMGSWGNVPLPNGTPVWDINLDLYDGTGTALNSTDLTATPPNPNAFELHEINIGGDSFFITAQVDSIQATTGNNNPDIVSFAMDAVVTWVDDTSGALGGAVTTGQDLSGTYTFNLTTPDEDPGAEFGRYTHQPGSGEFGFDFNVGGLNFKSDSSQAPMYVELYNSSFNDNYMAYSYGFNVPLPSGAVVTDMSIYMYDDSGNLIDSDQLSANPPVIGTSGWYEIYISGMSPNGVDYFSINAVITNISVSDPSNSNQMIVSPPTGLYDRFQLFDIALIFAPNLLPVNPDSITMLINGVGEPLYGCMRRVYSPENRETFVCPGPSFLLGTGINTVDFKVQLEDGTILRQSVDWEIIGY